MTPTEKAELMSKTYVEGASAYEEDERAREQIVELNRKIYEIAAAGETVIADLEDMILDKDLSKSAKAKRELEIAKIYFWGRDASYQYFKDFYKSI